MGTRGLAVGVAVANGKTLATNQTISLAASGTAASSDYSLSATELTLRAGASSATVTVTDDVILEGDETVTVTASHGGQSVGSATVTIEANDTPLSNDATLSSLALSGVDIGAYADARHGRCLFGVWLFQRPATVRLAHESPISGKASAGTVPRRPPCGEPQPTRPALTRWLRSPGRALSGFRRF